MVRIHAGEPNIISGRFRRSSCHSLLFRRNRNRQQVKGLPIFRGQFAAFPRAVREYKIQELPFFLWGLTLEQGVRIVRQFQESDAFLDVAVVGGLVRLHRSNTRAFADNSVLSLLSLTNGDLWIGTEGGGLILYSHKIFTRYSTQQGLTNTFVRAIYQDRSGKLWVGTDRGVFRRQGERFVRLDGTPQTPPVSAAEIREDSDGRLWIFGNGIYRLEDGVLVKQDSGLTRGMTAIQEQADRSIWLATANGLMEMKDGRLKPIASPAAEPLRLLRDDSGNTWVGAGNGLFLARGGRIVPFEDSEPMPSTSVLALYQDHENNIWVGTGDGLVRLHKAAVTKCPHLHRRQLPGSAISRIDKLIGARFVGDSHGGGIPLQHLPGPQGQRTKQRQFREMTREFYG